MGSWLQQAARRHPDRDALEAPERALTYAELDDGARAEARELSQNGVAPGERVPIAASDPVAFVTRLHACLLHGAAAVPIDQRLTAGEQAERAAAGRVAGVGVGVAAVMYTSGTTAAAKAVELTTANFLASALGSAAVLGLDLEERWLCPMPLSHVGGLSIPIRSAIYATTAVLHGRFDTEAVLAELMNPARRMTLVSLVPTMLERLLDAGLEHPPTLRWALVGGGPISEPLLARAGSAGVPVAPTYGMTEACSQIATFGWPLPGIELRLAGAQHEILVRGPVVSPAALALDGWLHTGDAGELDERGRLRITGRLSDAIVSGGENVAPAEVEATLLAHPAVQDAVVFGRQDPEWGEAVIAAVVRREGAELEPEVLLAFCREHLAGFKVPKAVEFLDRLPRTSSGKLRRRELA